MLVVRMRQFTAMRRIEQLRAVHAVNISLSVQHDWCDPLVSVETFLNGVDAFGADLVLWVGPCSTSTETVAALSTVFKVSHTGIMGVEESLSAKDAYPFFNRVVAPSSQEYEDFTAFIVATEWTSISILLQDTPGLQAKSLLLRNSVTAAGITIATSASGFYDVPLMESMPVEEMSMERDCPDYFDAMMLVTDPTSSDARVIAVILNTNWGVGVYQYLKLKEYIPFDQRFVCLFPSSTLEYLPPAGNFVMKPQVAADLPWDELCNLVMAEYYDWYQAAAAESWYHLTPHLDWGDTWFNGFINSTHFMLDGWDTPPGGPVAIRYNCENWPSLNARWYGLSEPLDAMNYSLNALDKLLAANEDPHDASAWGKYMRNTGEQYEGLGGTFQLNENRNGPSHCDLNTPLPEPGARPVRQELRRRG